MASSGVKTGDRILLKGNEAVVEGAMAAGCQAFFGYPITPQNEIPEYMSKRMVEDGRVFLQAESEVASINMIYGAAASGARVMTSSSSPGISLMMEGLSYCAGAALPCVLVNCQRGGPGLGNIAPAQADYWQATRGGGHGDYRLIVLAPNSVQEIYDTMGLAFDLADKYTNPVMVLTDAVLGAMLEPVTLHPISQTIPEKPWATTGTKKARKHNIINSLDLGAEGLEKLNLKNHKKYTAAERDEVRYEEREIADADIVLVAYGTCARVCRTAMQMARAEGIKVGLLRPITLWPYPYDRIRELRDRVKAFLCVEMSCGQMLDDVRLAVAEHVPVEFHGRMGGHVPSPGEVLAAIKVIT